MSESKNEESNSENGEYITAYNRDDRYIAVAVKDGYHPNSKIKTSRTDIPIDWKKTGPLIENLASSANKYALSKEVVYIKKVVKTKAYLEAKKKKKEKKELDKQNTETQEFWNIISKVQCLDKDEGNMTRGNIRSVLPHRDMVLRLLRDKFIPKLREVLSSTPLSDGIDVDEYDNLLTHIVFKGKVFYDAIVVDPIFSLYLCNQYYPIYTWLTN